MSTRVIVIGGGLSGVSCANQILQNGGNVLILDKCAFNGGNSTKATSGINATYTSTQMDYNIKDSVSNFQKDIYLSSTSGKEEKPYELGKVLAEQSGSAVEWLKDKFKIDLSIVSIMGGHSAERTHRGKEFFPGMSITMGLLKELEKIAKTNPDRCQIINKATVTKILYSNNRVTGCIYTDKDGLEKEEYGPVVICTGGYGADYGSDSLLLKYRPELMDFATTNGSHCTGDGIKMALEIGADLQDIEYVQVHPTGLVDPKNPECKVKLLAAEALRGEGGIMINSKGQRFVNELGRRDFVSNTMLKLNQGPYLILLGKDASDKIKWHCNHYVARGLMSKKSLKQLAQFLKISEEILIKTLNDYNKHANKECEDPFGRKYIKNPPNINDEFFVGVVTPVVHYTMGGLKVDTDSSVLDKQNGIIYGLWAAGEVMGGTHGTNRLGGNSLLDCVVYGRIAGRNASYYLFQNCLNYLKTDNNYKSTLGSIKSHIVKNQQTQIIDESNKSYNSKIEDYKTNYISRSELKNHKEEGDIWVAVNGEVLNVSNFIQDHPGGSNAILAYGGKDATGNFNMFHPKDTVQDYAPETRIGILKD